MPEIPECLHRRYKVLDELIGELSAVPSHRSHQESVHDSHDPGIKLMCDFWNILKEAPDCNLSQAVKQRMGLEVRDSRNMFSRQVTCYMASRDSDENKKPDALHKIKDICCGNDGTVRHAACRMSSSREKTPEMPLSKALCNLKEAASLDKKCNVRVNELMEAQKELKAQIQILEQREREGVSLLKEADCMWSCMEEEYKNKIAEAIDRQKELMKQLREVERNNSKWRKNKKELEDQLKSVAKCRQEMAEKTMHKTSDLKVIEMEVTDFNRRIANNKRLSDGSKQVLSNKKAVSEKRLANIAAEMTKLKNTLGDAQKYKNTKEEEGQRFVKEAREDLQKICKVLLQKKIQNEDLIAEKEALLQEIELLKQSSDQCKDKCESKKKSINEEIKKVENEITGYKYQCVQCHQCTGTTDARRMCSDCPKCKEQRECITKGDHCKRDSTFDCVCCSIKEKFLNNVFENMYTIMERQSKTTPGKKLADAIVNCLKNSRNGKLNAETRQQVQEFVLNNLRENLNLTIVGGAVKTRCEMDPDTYSQLVLCLHKVKVERPPKEDKGTVAKKESCRRWGGPSECNCPGGPRHCACSRRAPPPPPGPSPCPPALETEQDPAAGTVVVCPHKEPVGCGPTCAATPSPEQPHPSKACDASCPFKKNMRAAQCVLGPESLNSMHKTYMTSTPHIPTFSGYSDKEWLSLYGNWGRNKKCFPTPSNVISLKRELKKKINSKIVSAPAKPCTCKQDDTRPREWIIEEVLGRYSEITPIAKVKSIGERDEMNLGKNSNHDCKCNLANASKDGVTQIFDCSPNTLLIEGTDALMDMLRKKNMTHACNILWNGANASEGLKLFPESGNGDCRDVDAGVHLIIHANPRVDKTKGHKISRSPPPQQTQITDYSKRYKNTNDQRADGRDFSQNRATNRQVVIQGLLKDVKMSYNIDENFSPDVKWVNIDTYKLIIKHLSAHHVSKHKNSNVDNSVKKSLHVKKLKKSDAKQLKAKCSRNRTYTTRDKHALNDMYDRYSSEQINKLKKQTISTSSISTQVMNLTENASEIENLFIRNNPPKNTKEIKSFGNESKFLNKNIQSKSPVNDADLTSAHFHLEKLIDFLDAKFDEDSDTLNKSKAPKTPNIQKPLDNSYASVKIDNNKLQSIQNQKILKLKLQQSYEENKTITIKFENETGICKVIKTPVTKTLSGNLAVDINILCDVVEMNNKERNVALQRSDSGAIIFNKKLDADDFANAVLRKTSSGSFLLVMVDPVFRPRKIVKRIAPPIERFYRVKLESVDYDTVLPPMILKKTPSHNYLVVPDKEYENQYKEAVQNLLEDSTEYYVNLKQTDSQACVIQIDDIWNDNKPNALILRTDSGEVKIVSKLNAETNVGSGRKRTSITSSSKVVGEVLGKLPRTKDNIRLSVSSNKAMIPKKSSSDSNLYQKGKLFYSNQKSPLAEPSAILKMTNSGQYAFVLDKESKINFIKKMKSYLKYNSQGLIPIEKTDSGQITIVLNGDQTEKKHYGSLKITPSGNLYIIVDKELVNDITEEDSLDTNIPDNSFYNITSRHIIGKLQCPVNKAVTTTCNAMPENDCDNSKCACAHIKLKKSGWIVNHYQTDKIIHFFGTLDRKNTSSPVDSYNICDIKSTEKGFNTLTSGIKPATNGIKPPDNGIKPDTNGIKPDTNGTKPVSNGTKPPTNSKKQRPHITIKPCEPLLDNSQCYEPVSPFDKNMSLWPEPMTCKDVQNKVSWDSLSFLPPQLPHFLKDFKYK